MNDRRFKSGALALALGVVLAVGMVGCDGSRDNVSERYEGPRTDCSTYKLTVNAQKCERANTGGGNDGK